MSNLTEKQAAIVVAALRVYRNQDLTRGVNLVRGGWVNTTDEEIEDLENIFRRTE